MKARLVEMVERGDTRAGRTFDLIVLALIVCALIALSVETLPGLPPAATRALAFVEVVVTLLFTVEYGLRVYAAERKWRYVFSFYGLVDIVAIVPFYISLGGVDLLVVRVVRIFRVFQILKVFRYSTAINRYMRALQLAREEILLFLLAAGILLYLSAVGIYYFERDAQPENFQSILHSLWWAVATLTTVGYGDIYPVTAGGKVFTFLVLVCGLGIVAAPSGLVAAALSRARGRGGEGVGSTRARSLRRRSFAPANFQRDRKVALPGGPWRTACAPGLTASVVKRSRHTRDRSASRCGMRAVTEQETVLSNSTPSPNTPSATTGSLHARGPLRQSATLCYGAGNVRPVAESHA